MSLVTHLTCVLEVLHISCRTGCPDEDVLWFLHLRKKLILMLDEDCLFTLLLIDKVLV
jgi:hypothetical protein